MTDRTRADIAALTARVNAAVVGQEARSEERRGGKRVDLGGRRIIKKKKQKLHVATVHTPIYPHHHR